MSIRLVFGIKNKYVELTKRALKEFGIDENADFTVYVFFTTGRFHTTRLDAAVKLIKNDTKKARKGIFVVIGDGSEALPSEEALLKNSILCTAVRVPVSNNPTQFEIFKKEFIAAINNNKDKTIEVLTEEQMAEYQNAQEAEKMAKKKAKEQKAKRASQPSKPKPSQSRARPGRRSDARPGRKGGARRSKPSRSKPSRSKPSRSQMSEDWDVATWTRVAEALLNGNESIADAIKLGGGSEPVTDTDEVMVIDPATAKSATPPPAKPATAKPAKPATPTVIDLSTESTAEMAETPEAKKKEEFSKLNEFKEDITKKYHEMTPVKYTKNRVANLMKCRIPPKRKLDVYKYFQRYFDTVDEQLARFQILADAEAGGFGIQKISKSAFYKQGNYIISYNGILEKQGEGFIEKYEPAKICVLDKLTLMEETSEIDVDKFMNPQYKAKNYQKEAVYNLMDGGLLYHKAGSGKTLTSLLCALHITKRLQPVVVVAHNQQILQQFQKEIEKFIDVDAHPRLWCFITLQMYLSGTKKSFASKDGTGGEFDIDGYLEDMTTKCEDGTFIRDAWQSEIKKKQEQIKEERQNDTPDRSQIRTLENQIKEIQIKWNTDLEEFRAMQDNYAAQLKTLRDGMALSEEIASLEKKLDEVNNIITKLTNQTPYWENYKSRVDIFDSETNEFIWFTGDKTAGVRNKLPPLDAFYIFDEAHRYFIKDTEKKWNKVARMITTHCQQAIFLTATPFSSAQGTGKLSGPQKRKEAFEELCINKYRTEVNKLTPLKNTAHIRLGLPVDKIFRNQRSSTFPYNKLKHGTTALLWDSMGLTQPFPRSTNLYESKPFKPMNLEVVHEVKLKRDYNVPGGTYDFENIPFELFALHTGKLTEVCRYLETMQGQAIVYHPRVEALKHLGEILKQRGEIAGAGAEAGAGAGAEAKSEDEYRYCLKKVKKDKRVVRVMKDYPRLPSETACSEIAFDAYEGARDKDWDEKYMPYLPTFPADVRSVICKKYGIVEKDIWNTAPTRKLKVEGYYGTVEKDKKAAFEAFQNPNEKVDVLLMSSAGKEGIDFKSLKCQTSVLFLAPLTNYDDVVQVAARVIRTGSHTGPEFDRVVVIKIFCAEMKSNDFEAKQEQEGKTVQKQSEPPTFIAWPFQKPSTRPERAGKKPKTNLIVNIEQLKQQIPRRSRTSPYICTMCKEKLSSSDSKKSNCCNYPLECCFPYEMIYEHATGDEYEDSSQEYKDVDKLKVLMENRKTVKNLTKAWVQHKKFTGNMLSPYGSLRINEKILEKKLKRLNFTKSDGLQFDGWQREATEVRFDGQSYRLEYKLVKRVKSKKVRARSTDIKFHFGDFVQDDAIMTRILEQGSKTKWFSNFGNLTFQLTITKIEGTGDDTEPDTEPFTYTTLSELQGKENDILDRGFFIRQKGSKDKFRGFLLAYKDYSQLKRAIKLSAEAEKIGINVKLNRRNVGGKGIVTSINHRARRLMKRLLTACDKYKIVEGIEKNVTKWKQKYEDQEDYSLKNKIRWKELMKQMNDENKLSQEEKNIINDDGQYLSLNERFEDIIKKGLVGKDIDNFIMIQKRKDYEALQDQQFPEFVPRTPSNIVKALVILKERAEQGIYTKFKKLKDGRKWSLGMQCENIIAAQPLVDAEKVKIIEAKISVAQTRKSKLDANKQVESSPKKITELRKDIASVEGKIAELKMELQSAQNPDRPDFYTTDSPVDGTYYGKITFSPEGKSLTREEFQWQDIYQFIVGGASLGNAAKSKWRAVDEADTCTVV